MLPRGGADDDDESYPGGGPPPTLEHEPEWQKRLRESGATGLAEAEYEAAASAMGEEEQAELLATPSRRRSSSRAARRCRSVQAKEEEVASLHQS